MKKSLKAAIAVLLSVSIMLLSVTGAGALDAEREKTAKTAGFVDNLLEAVLDPVFGFLVNCLFNADSLFNRFPTVDEYFAQNHDDFYAGTDGQLTGTGWKLGYAGESVIPTSWRVDADGKQADDGMNLNKTYFFGGYFGSTVNKIYDDERVNLAILSPGTDRNQNGIKDIIIIASLDNIGMSNGNVRRVRNAVAKELAKEGVVKDDILAFQFGCTHAHTVIEALGMSLDTVFVRALLNHLLSRNKSSVNDELLDTICEKTAKAAKTAYDGMEEGTLGFYETKDLTDFMNDNAINKDNKETKAVKDKLGYGAACQQTIAGWCFKSESGKKTVLANTGMHPTFAGRDSKRVCADFPHYFNLAMQEMGCNLVFMQGSQAAISPERYYSQAGKDWAERNRLSKEEWTRRYGSKYADKNYDTEEDGYFTMKAFGYTLAQAVTDAVETATAVSPKVNIKMKETVMTADYSIVYLGAVASVFGYNTVRTKSETGYGIVTEIGYMMLGDGVAMLLLPGEVSPAITFGKASDYNGNESWSGEYSWSGESWNYKTLKEMAQEKLGADTKIYAMGIANDEIAYVMPDTDCAKNFLTKSLTSSMGYHVGRGNNEELMMISKNAGSDFVKGYAALFGVNAEKN